MGAETTPLQTYSAVNKSAFVGAGSPCPIKMGAETTPLQTQDTKLKTQNVVGS